MKQKISLMLMAVMLLSGYGINRAQAVTAYDYEVVSQSGNPTLKQGETKLIWVKLKNTGSETWKPDSWMIPLEDKYGESCVNGDETSEEDVKGGCILPPMPSTENPFRLGTIHPQDRNSGFKSDYDWVSTNRVNANFWEEIKPGQTVTIGFNIFAPYDMVPGTYPEYFAPVIENESWMPDKNLHWNITVSAQENKYAANVWNYYQSRFQLKPGESAEVIYDVKNTGQETWYKNGANPIHIGTVEPQDRSSRLYNTKSWIAPNRPNGISNEKVAPGENTTISFSITAPNEPVGTTISEAFWLVAENKTWFVAGEYPNTAMEIIVDIIDEDTNIIDMENSSITTDNDKVIADNIDSTTLMIELIDKQGNHVTNQELMLTAYGCVKIGLGCWQEEEQKLITDNKGQASIKVKSDKESTVNYGFHVGDLYNYSSLTIDFYKVGHESIAFNKIVADKTKISISKNESATLESYLKFDNGDPVSFYSVEVIIDNGQNVIYDNAIMPPWPYVSTWTSDTGKVSHKINATNYAVGDTLKIKFRANNLPPALYDSYVESNEVTLEII